MFLSVMGAEGESGVEIVRYVCDGGCLFKPGVEDLNSGGLINDGFEILCFLSCFVQFLLGYSCREKLIHIDER